MEEIDEIQKAASWCLNCKAKPCVEEGCPMKTNIPEFIEQIKKENYKEAYKILIGNNVFSHICSIICPQENQCEGRCIRGIKQTSTQIGKLEKFVNEVAKKNNYSLEIKLKEKNGKKVAIIGSGPAGLECAVELLKNGYNVTIFEKDNIPGGILTYGIPDFRLSKEIIKEIVFKVESLGAEIKTCMELGKDINIKKLKNEYDAIFLGTGAARSLTYSLYEKKLDNIYESDVFLKAYNDNNFLKDLGIVVVIGGGNVAMDSARAAIRMGAKKVKILYRRDQECMPARKVEIQECLEDGTEIKYLTRVISANLDEMEKIKSLNCIKTEIKDKKAVDLENTEFLEEANTVVFAIGLKPDKKILEDQGIELDEYGYIKTDKEGQTNIKNVYAGGDNTENKSTVCRALAAGKKAAEGIARNV